MNLSRLILFSIIIIAFVTACKVSTETGKRHSSVQTDPESIAAGKQLFNRKCVICHDIESSEMRTGPGLVGILKKSKLPVSKKPATPENIKRQLLDPYERMPSFTYLSEDDIQDLIAFLNTL